MESRDKKILIGVGVALAASAASFFYNGSHDRELVEHAKYKAVAGDLKESMQKMQDLQDQARKDANDKKNVALAKKPASLTSAPLEMASVTKMVSAVSTFKDEVHLGNLPSPTGSIAPMPANVPPSGGTMPTAALASPVDGGVAAVTPLTAPAEPISPSPIDLKVAEFAASDSSLYLRYKGYLLRVILKHGLAPDSTALEGFVGQHIETIASDQDSTSCSESCYQLSEKLMGLVKVSKASRVPLKAQGWFLVSDQIDGECGTSAGHKMRLTQDFDGKCVVGVVTEGNSVHMSLHDIRGRQETSSVMVMQKMSSREVASGN